MLGFGLGPHLDAPGIVGDQPLLKLFMAIESFHGEENDWLVVSTPLKNISQLGIIIHYYSIFMDHKKMFETTNQNDILILQWN